HYPNCFMIFAGWNKANIYNRWNKPVTLAFSLRDALDKLAEQVNVNAESKKQFRLSCCKEEGNSKRSVDSRKEMTINDPVYLEYFNKAKEEGARLVNRGRVMIVGQYGVGKTSLMKRLLGQGFSEEYNTTDGIDASSIDIKTTQGFEFVEVTDDIQKTYDEAIAKDVVQSDTDQKSGTTRSMALRNVSSNAPSDTLEPDAVQDNISESKQEQVMDLESDDPKKPDAALDNIHERKRQKLIDSESVDVKKPDAASSIIPIPIQHQIKELESDDVKN
ncbi:unnamed protein product, partial [Owenia fusiformis]